eukprot:GHVU01062096.1.p3 GENE.GHVU01062096.1~~GHVU01062096.1.p3  ORF type:complete len:129 (+),score=24.52 GHVU01062096.1:364-750(+)
MAFTLDYSTNAGKLRLLISDIDSTNPIFQDDAIDAFLSIAQGGNVKRAAATALMVIATNEVLVQKRIKLLDLQTDGPAEAIQLRLLAKELKEEAEAEEVTGSFDWAEQVNNPGQWTEYIYKDALRNGS